ncbi:DUF1330 domain-containing protein [Gordonia sp. NPDC003424]
MSIIFTVLLWSVDGRDDDLHTYEDDVLPMVAEHRGRVRTRLRALTPDDRTPHETQVIEFPDDAAFDAYMADPRRIAMADRREKCIARTSMWRVEPFGTSQRS